MKMYYSLNNIKKWTKWKLIHAHMCTLAVSLSYNSLWHTPALAARFGGVQYALAASGALLLLGLPLALLHLAVGQLSQQDAVGVWRAVPIFQGVGYLRLLVSFLGSIYTSIYLALAVSYFFYTISNSIPFSECTEFEYTADGYINIFNASDCLDATFLSPVRDNPEYYLSMAFIIIFIWITVPFLLYNPVKIMKRLFYVLGPLIIVLCVVVLSGMGQRQRLALLVQGGEWQNYLQPDIWFHTASQTLFTTEVAGGYLISAGDSVYSSCNIQWVAVVIIVISVMSNWFAVVFSFAVGGSSESVAGTTSVLEQLYEAALTQENATWPLLGFALLILSGLVSMLIRLYPICERLRRAGGAVGGRWRAWCAGAACAGAACALAALPARRAALIALHHRATPLLAILATILELVAFLFIYGRKTLIEDIEFLTDDKLNKIWLWGWWTSLGVLLPVTIWWTASIIGDGEWIPAEEDFALLTLTITATLAAIVFTVCAVIAVLKQVQYDFIGKLKSSLKPSRHWGPRDPITHYYWLSRREGDRAGGLQRDQHSQHGSTLDMQADPNQIIVAEDKNNDTKKRSNSDDLIYTVYRRKHIQELLFDYGALSKKYRSNSLDWNILPNLGSKKKIKEFDKTLSNLNFNSTFKSFDTMAFQKKNSFHSEVSA